jgi:hypothetical protein
MDLWGLENSTVIAGDTDGIDGKTCWSDGDEKNSKRTTYATKSTVRFKKKNHTAGLGGQQSQSQITERTTSRARRVRERLQRPVTVKVDLESSSNLKINTSG